jgi:hypothetical protein
VVSAVLAVAIMLRISVPITLVVTVPLCSRWCWDGA